MNTTPILTNVDDHGEQLGLQQSQQRYNRQWVPTNHPEIGVGDQYSADAGLHWYFICSVHDTDPRFIFRTMRPIPTQEAILEDKTTNALPKNAFQSLESFEDRFIRILKEEAADCRRTAVMNDSTSFRAVAMAFETLANRLQQK